MSHIYAFIFSCNCRTWSEKWGGLMMEDSISRSRKCTRPVHREIVCMNREAVVIWRLVVLNVIRSAGRWMITKCLKSISPRRSHIWEPEVIKSGAAAAAGGGGATRSQRLEGNLKLRVAGIITQSGTTEYEETLLNVFSFASYRYLC